MDPTESSCFVCKTGTLLLSSTSLEVPYFGEVNVTTFTCDSCGYRSTDVLPLRSRAPSRYRCTVKGEDTLDIRVIRSHTGTVLIPEIGVRIDPGVAADGFITNVEGILERVEGIIDQVLRGSYEGLERPDEDRRELLSRVSKCLAIKDRIGAARSGTSPLTILIEDPTGNSAIVGKDRSIERSDLTDADLAYLSDGPKPSD